MGNPFVYIQLHSRDPQRAKEFYKNFLDWDYKELSTGPESYTEIIVGEGTAGGIMRCRDAATQSHWLPYIRVADIREAVEKAQSLGGTILLAPTNLPGKGIFSVLTDPTGAQFALWQLVS